MIPEGHLMTRTRKFLLVALTVSMGLFLTINLGYGRRFWYPYLAPFLEKKTVNSVLQSIGQAALGRLRPDFDRMGMHWPPTAVILIGLKTEKRMELWTEGNTGPVHIKNYPVLAASGTIGPKLREGDWQVPEGTYEIESLNPNSSYHLSLKINYPNPSDLKRAANEGRTEPGSNIFIHGKSASVGCLAMGDPAAEELFCLAAMIGREKIKVILVPHDLRILPPPGPKPGEPVWIQDMYQELTRALKHYQQLSHGLSSDQ